MSRKALTLALLALALPAPAARGQEPDAPPSPAVQAGATPPEALRETLPGGAELREADALPRASVDVLPRPTQIEIVARRRAPPPKD